MRLVLFFFLSTKNIFEWMIHSHDAKIKIILKGWKISFFFQQNIVYYHMVSVPNPNTFLNINDIHSTAYQLRKTIIRTAISNALEVDIQTVKLH